MPSFITEELEKSRDKKSFVAQVMDILVSEDASSTMWWLEDGRSFAVKTSTLEEDVLDKHFRGSKASSFTRRMSKVCA